MRIFWVPVCGACIIRIGIIFIPKRVIQLFTVLKWFWYWFFCWSHYSIIYFSWILMTFWRLWSSCSFTVSYLAGILRSLILCNCPANRIIVTSISFITWITSCCLASIHIILFQNRSFNGTLYRESFVSCFIKISFLLLLTPVNRHSGCFIYFFRLYILGSSSSLWSNRILLIWLKSRFRSIILILLSQTLMLIITLLSFFSYATLSQTII